MSENFMNEPIDEPISPSDIMEFYCQTNDKKKTAEVYGLTVKELNKILGFTKKRKSDPLKEIGMSKKDFL